MHRSGDYEDKKLYISQLPLSANEKDVRALFEKYGQIVQCFVVMKDRKSKGNAFVEFENKKDCEEALKELNNYKFGNKNIIVQKAKSLPPEERERKKFNQSKQLELIPQVHNTNPSNRIDRERFRDNRMERNPAHQYLQKESDRLIDISSLNDLSYKNLKSIKEIIDRLNSNRMRIEKLCGTDNYKVYDYILTPSNS